MFGVICGGVKIVVMIGVAVVMRVVVIIVETAFGVRGWSQWNPE